PGLSRRNPFGISDLTAVVFQQTLRRVSLAKGAAGFDAGARMQLNLTGQRVAVFGAARGIGRAIAEAFLSEGCHVHGFDQDDAAPPLSSGSRLSKGDVTAYAQVRAFVDRIGEIDHVVFSVGAGS